MSASYRHKAEHEELSATIGKATARTENFLKSDSRRIDAVDSLGWACDASRIVMCAKDGSVRVHRADEARGNEEFHMSGSWTHAEPHPLNSEIVACVGWDGRIRMLDLRGGYGECKGEEKIFSASFSCEGNSLAINTRSDTVHVYDTRNLSNPVAVQLKHEVHSIAWSRAGEVWSGLGNGELALIDPRDMETIAQPRNTAAHQGAVNAIARDSAGSKLVSGGTDGVVAVWDSDKVLCERTIVEAQSCVTTVNVSGCGRLVAFGCGKEGDCGLYMAGVNTGVLYKTMETSNPVVRVAIHPRSVKTVAFALHLPQPGDSSIVQIATLE